MKTATIVAWILAFSTQSQGFSPSSSKRCPLHDFNTVSHPAPFDSSPSPIAKSLPPGRPTARFLRFLCDDTVRLLNPRDMKLLNRKHEYGPIFKTNVLFKRAVFCSSPEAIQELAKEEALHRGSLRAFFPPHHQKLFGSNSIIVQSGDTHQRLRTIIMSSMTPIVMESYKPLIETSMASFFDTLAKESSQDFIEMVPKIRSFFISIMLQVVLGTTNISNDLIQDIEIWAQGLLAPPLTFLPWSTASKAVRARERIVVQLQDLMATSKNDGLLNKLMEAKDDDGNTLSEVEVIDNLFTLIFAGSDTSSAAATSVWSVLSQDPELRKALAEANDDLLDEFVHQILEAYPSAPFNMRETTEELTIGEYKVPAGWLVAYGFAAALENSKPPTVQSLKEIVATKNAASSIAFGQGPRKCPGRYLAVCELKAFTQILIQRDWELEPEQNLEKKYTPGFFPIDGLKAKVNA